MDRIAFRGVLTNDKGAAVLNKASGETQHVTTLTVATDEDTINSQPAELLPWADVAASDLGVDRYGAWRSQLAKFSGAPVEITIRRLTDLSPDGKSNGSAKGQTGLFETQPGASAPAEREDHEPDECFDAEVVRVSGLLSADKNQIRRELSRRGWTVAFLTEAGADPLQVFFRGEAAPSFRNFLYLWDSDEKLLRKHAPLAAAFVDGRGLWKATPDGTGVTITGDISDETEDWLRARLQAVEYKDIPIGATPEELDEQLLLRGWRAGFYTADGSLTPARRAYFQGLSPAPPTEQIFVLDEGARTAHVLIPLKRLQQINGDTGEGFWTADGVELWGEVPAHVPRPKQAPTPPEPNGNRIVAFPGTNAQRGARPRDQKGESGRGNRSKPRRRR